MPRSQSRNWDSLSGNYRARLERNGVTRREYESGANLSSARGHAHTPENPGRAVTDESRFPDYTARRNDLIATIEILKREVFVSSPKWNENRALKNISVNPYTGKRRGIKELRKIEKILEDALSDDLAYDEMTDGVDIVLVSALYYH